MASSARGRLLTDAVEFKAVPGHKTDANDATRIADLAAFGLLKASFLPDEDLHELRTLMRTREQRAREQSSHVERIQKMLTEANLRMDSAISDIMGLNGRRMIEAVIAGEHNPRKFVALTDRGLKATPKELYDALHGRLTDHLRFLLELELELQLRLRRNIATRRGSRLEHMGEPNKTKHVCRF